MGFWWSWYSGGMKKEFDKWNKAKKRCMTLVFAYCSNIERCGGVGLVSMWGMRLMVNKSHLFVLFLFLEKYLQILLLVFHSLKRKKESIIEKNLTHLYYILRENIRGNDGGTYCSMLDLSQIRLFDVKRLVSREYRVHENTFHKIKSSVQQLLF